MKQNKKWANVGQVLTMTSCLVATSWAGITPAMASSTPAAVEQQQGQTVKGVVKDKAGDPVVGASVVEKGTSNGTITDIDGKFSLKTKSTSSKLIVSYVGYESKEVAPNGKELKITLQENSELLDDVVVIGYGTQRKADVTSAVASIKAEDFSAGLINSPMQLVKGKIAGLTITNSSGDPTSGSGLMLRGVGTISASNSPLYIIDGVPGSMSDVAPENIESIDVLKDGSSAAIYGTRGANGVILITTKSGKREAPMTVTYNAYGSFSNWSKKSDFMTASDIANNLTTFSDEGADTDWLSEVTNKCGYAQNHSLTLAGGTKSSAYSANATYTDQEGIMKNNGVQSIRLQMDLTHYALHDKIKFNVNAFFNESNSDLNNNTFVYREAIIRNPTSPVYNSDGSYNENWDKLYYYNPVEMQNEYYGDNRSRTYRLSGEVMIEPIKNWRTTFRATREENNSVSQSYTTANHYSYAQSNEHATLVDVTCTGCGKTLYSYTSSYNGYANKSQATSQNNNIDLTSFYNKNFGKHRVEALIGYSYNYMEDDNFYAGNGNFPTAVTEYNDLGSGTYLTEKDRHASMGSNKEDHRLAAYFGRLTYAFGDKYNLLASFRREGSSRFGKNNKWGNFPAVSAGWTLSNEDFMDNVEVVNNLKLRVGYGVTGREPGENYLAQNYYKYDSYGDILGKDGSWIQTIAQQKNPNPDLKWETSRELNVGLDWSVLESRISGSIDFYNKYTADLIYEYNVPVPPNLYSMTWANVGDMRNVGFEVLINAVPVKTHGFEWNTTITFSHNKNKLISLNDKFYQTDSFHEVGGLGEPISVATHCMEEGRSLGEFWGLKSVGVDRLGRTLVEVKDADGNWTVKPFDTNLNVQENRQRLGSGTPKFLLGWGNTFTYKGFDLSMQFTGQFGYKILNAQRCYYECNSSVYNRLKSADKQYHAVQYNKTTGELEALYDTNGNAITTKLSKTQSQGFWSDHLEKGDFLKLNDLTLGYTIPLKNNVRNWVNDIHVYASCQNVFYITKYSGIDPEVSNDPLTPGIDYQDKYPTVRTYTIGLSVKF